MHDRNIYAAACDLGSSGGKIFLGAFTGDTVSIEEIHRFSLQPVHTGSYYYTDVLYIWSQILESLKKISARGIQPHSLAIDSWGVDYAYLDKNGELAGNPLNYRNDRTLYTLEKLGPKGWSKEKLYGLTGTAAMPYNTLFQIYEDLQSRRDIVTRAHTMLFIPDLFAYWLCGRRSTERTIASTAQMVDISRGEWAEEMLSSLGFPVGILPEIQECGTLKGMLLPEIASSVGLKPFPIIAGGSHDTASAVASTPLLDGQSVYLSSGSWSLLGAELHTPVLNLSALTEGFTNEAGFGGTTRFLKGINGLWILQLLQRKWGLSFPELIAEAEKYRDAPFQIDVSENCFYNPEDIEHEIIRSCSAQGQGAPTQKGEILAAFYHGLSGVYVQSVKILERILGCKASSLHIVGGGSRDRLLNSLTAQALTCPIYAGPVESSALGNILIQLKYLGCLSSLEDMRRLVSSSFDIKKL